MSVDHAAEATFDAEGRPVPRVLVREKDDPHSATDRDTTSAGPSFEYERLRMFAANELSAWPAMPLLALVVCLALVNWAPIEQLGLWLAAVLMAKGIVLALCRQLENGPADADAWRGKLWAAEFLYGMTWAGLAFVDITSHHQAAYFLIFAAFVIVVASRMIFASTVMPLLYPGTIPLTAALVLRSALMGDMFYLSLAIVATAIHVYFILLARGLNATLLDMLSYRAQKDALIAELEQSRAISEEARRRAENASMAKSRFLATMSHELRTPLNAILGFSEVMKDEVLGPHTTPTYRNYAADIYDSGQHLLHLINEILDLSRIEAGRYELNESRVPLAEVMEDCRRLMIMRAEEKGVDFVEDYEGMPEAIRADERAVRQICLNLLSNAIKFTPAGGKVTLRCSINAAGEPYLSVSDNGPGIPEHEVPLVLRSFGQGEFARENAEGGSGLGLPIVKGLAELHGGRLELNTREGQGTTATVVFDRKRLIAASNTDALERSESSRPPKVNAA
jgi:two-component system cell cycle sensor histidine kinase PleC